MLVKWIMVLFLILIFISLLYGLYHLVRGQSGTNHVAWALTVRVGLSIALVLFLVIIFYFGWLQPHAL